MTDSAATLSSLEQAQRWFRRNVAAKIANLKLAISMLLIIAFFSIAGTVIEQGQPPAYYQTNYPEHPALFGFLSWKVIQVVGLDHVYRTWWYLSLLAFFWGQSSHLHLYYPATHAEISSPLAIL